MSANTEVTSNSSKFVPLTIAAMMPNLIPLQFPPPDSPDSSYISVEDENSFSETENRSTPTFKTAITAPSQPHSQRREPNKPLIPKTPLKKKPLIQSHTPLPPKHAHETPLNKKPVISETPQTAKHKVTETPITKIPTISLHAATPLPTVPETPQTKPLTYTATLRAVPETPLNRNPSTCHPDTPHIIPATPINKVAYKPVTPCINVNTPVTKKIVTTHVVTPSLHTIPETPSKKKPTYAATPSYPHGAIGNQSKTFKSINIKGKSYIYIKTLGQGGSSKVFKVLEMSTSCEYAVKCVDLATDEELAQGYINEVQLLRKLQNSDRVIRLYDYEYDRTNQTLRVVLEAGETDLSSIIKAQGARLPPTLLLHYWEEMLLAVSYIHEHGVIHADLKPANFVLVCGRLKLIDFGIASAISSDATSVVRTHATGTYSYISPEALYGGAGGYGIPGHDSDAPIKISFRSDVWSLGCILYSMVYGRTPFGHMTNLAKLAVLLNPKHQIDYPPAEHIPPSLIAALKWCLTYELRSRPTVRQLLAISHLQPTRAPLPAPLLDKLRPLVTPEEMQLLQRARLIQEDTVAK